jgi:hypothetical protein
MTQREQPLQEYFPSARVRLIVRFEDYGAPDTPEVPERPSTLWQGKKDKAPALRVAEEEGKLVLLGASDDPSHIGSPQQQQGSRDQRTHVIEGIIPRSAQVMFNGVRTADTLSLEIQFRDMPIDPRTIRSCGVEYFLGTVPAEDYQRGIDGEIRTDSTPGAGAGLKWNVIPDGYIDRHGRRRTNLRFQGWVDEWYDEWGEGSAPMVRLECTDNTRLLLEQDAPPKLTIDPKQPIDRGIAEYLSNFPQFRGLSVQYLPTGAEIPVPSDALMRTKFRPKLGPAAAGGGTSELKVWDYLTDVVGSIGHTLRFEGTTLIIQRARTLYDARFTGRPDDPFTGRNLPSGRTLDRRLYVYGRNVADMSFGRKFATYSATNIEVRSYHTGKKKTLVARFPLKDDRQKQAVPGDAGRQAWKVIRVTGIRDEKTLRVIAQNIYESIGRNELEATFSTKNLGSFGGDNLDPDALDCLPGDAIDVEVLRSPLEEDDESTVNVIQDQIETRAAEFLEQLGFDAAFARAYQRAVDNIGFQTTFRVRTLGLDWDSETEGVTLDFECVNYIEIRADKDLDPDEQITPENTAGATPTRVVVDDEVGT